MKEKHEIGVYVANKNVSPLSSTVLIFYNLKKINYFVVIFFSDRRIDIYMNLLLVLYRFFLLCHGTEEFRQEFSSIIY